MSEAKTSKFEKIFNHWTLLGLNLVIIVAVEITGGFFMNSGLIHLIAILFIALGIGRIFIHYEVFDQFLKPLIYGGIATLILFAVSHVLEFAGYTIFYLPFDTIAANVVNFYLAGLLMIALSVALFLQRLEKGFKIFIYALPVGILASFVVIIFFYLHPARANLKPSDGLMYFYGFDISIVTALGILLMSELKKHVSIMANFLDYFNAGFVMIAGSALFYVFNDLFETIGVDYMQVMYISHFLFYGALSVMFLAFVRLAHLGGIYEEAEK